MAEGLVLNKMYKNKDYNAVFTSRMVRVMFLT